MTGIGKIDATEYISLNGESGSVSVPWDRPDPAPTARAFYWLTRAVEQGDRDADLLRQVLSATMTDAQFEVADHMMHVIKAGQ